MTNMRDVQTCTIGDLNVILLVAALINIHAIEVVREVVTGPWVHILVGINWIGTGVGRVAGTRSIFWPIWMVEAVATM
jgi:hypothetical protein